MSMFCDMVYVKQGQFAPVKGNYSEEFKTLIMDMLRQEPESRPSAVDLCNTRLPQVAQSSSFNRLIASNQCD